LSAQDDLRRAIISIANDARSTEIIRETFRAMPANSVKAFVATAASLVNAEGVGERNRLSDPVQHAVGVFAVAQIDREERPAEALQREITFLLSEFDRFGAGRSAAAKVARRLTADPSAQERIAQRIRRLAKKRKKKNAHCSVARDLRE
jgi:hypothetical protein